MNCPHAYTLTDPETNENPYAFYKWMHKEAPVYFDPALNMYIVSRYDLIREIATNTEVFSNEQAQLNQWNLRPGGLPAKARDILEAGVPQVPMLVTADPPRHNRSRALVNLAFVRGRVEKMQGYIETITNDLIDRFVEDGNVELVSQFAMPLPVYVISDQLGVPREDYARVKAWSDATVGLRGLMGSDDEIVRYAELLVDFQQYFVSLIEKRRIEGVTERDILDDLLSTTLENERPLDRAELISAIQQLMVAGNESTTSAIASAIAILLDNPQEIPALLGDEKRLKRFIEEVLRLEPPVQGNLRRAVANTEIAGVAIPKGALLQLRHAAGNRDGAAFDCPDQLDIEKDRPPHLGFGYGPHFCIGHALARKEIAVAVTALLRRLPGLRLAPQLNDFRHGRSIYIRGLKSLHLEFDAAIKRAV